MTQRRIYQCAFPYHITFNILKRRRIFDDVKKAEALHRIIHGSGYVRCHIVYQFAIMPDHVHMLVKPNHENTLAGRDACSCVFGVEPIDPTNVIKNRNACVPNIPPIRRAGLCARDVNKTTVFCGTCRESNIPNAEHHAIWNISDFIHSVKSYFVFQMREKFNIHHKCLQSRFYDEIIESDRQLNNVIDYIERNPMEANLPKKFQKSPYQYRNNDLVNTLF